MSENFIKGFEILGGGMAVVFGVLLIVYITIKIMGAYAKFEAKHKKSGTERE